MVSLFISHPVKLSHTLCNIVYYKLCYPGHSKVAPAPHDSKPILPGMCPCLHTTIPPRRGSTSLAVLSAGCGAQLLAGQEGLGLRVARRDSLQTAQFATLLRHMHHPADIRPRPSVTSRAMRVTHRHLRRGCGGSCSDHQSTLSLRHRSISVLDTADDLLQSAGGVHAG